MVRLVVVVVVVVRWSWLLGQSSGNVPLPGWAKVCY